MLENSLQQQQFSDIAIGERTQIYMNRHSKTEVHDDTGILTLHGGDMQWQPTSDKKMLKS